jgi:hypothetical protein
MALTYSLKYKKLNFFNKVLIEKEGEVVIDRQSFRLKGKGAQDMGQVIYFGDIKDLLIRKDHLVLTTYNKEKYALTNFANLFDSFLKDFLRVKNEYLADTLFMKAGMLIREYEGHVQFVNVHEKVIAKGKCRIQFYEGSIVFIPEIKETFAVYYNFLKSHEFDDDEYVLHLFMENGQVINVSKLGTAYEDVQETLESILGKMYERLINNFSEMMPGFDAQTLLKMINKFKEVKLVPFSSLKRIHENSQATVENILFEKNSIMKEKINRLRKLCGEQNFYVALNFHKGMENGDLTYRSWFMCAFPEKNLIAVGQTSEPKDQMIHFFRIIMQQGDAKDKLSAKVNELDNVLFLFRNDLTPIYKDRRELRKTKFRNIIKKLSSVRLLRKSHLGFSNTADFDKFEKDFELMIEKAKVSVPPAIKKEDLTTSKEVISEIN